MMVLRTFPFLICTQTSYKLHEITPEVLIEASRFFSHFPPQLYAADDG